VDLLAYVLIVAILLMFMYFQVVRSRDRGQRGRALGTLAKAFECEFDVAVPPELEKQLASCRVGEVLTMRNHFSCANKFKPIDLVDVRYAFTISRRRGIATSTIGRFDYSGPAFRWTPDPDPMAGVDSVPRDGDGTQTDWADAVQRMDLESLAPRLGQNIIESDGSQVFVYGWRTRILPDQIPAFIDLIDSVAAALG